MSSSYRNASRLQLAVAGACALASPVLLPGSLATAADTYVTPQVDLRAEYNDNFRLTPGGAGDSVNGYIADAQALFGIATPRSDTSIRPRLRLQEYPDEDELQRWEGFLDLRSRYDWQRARLDVLGRYSRQDSYNAETPTGEFDPLAPTDPTNADTGHVLVGETRDRFLFEPEYVFDLTERWEFGLEVQYEAVRYDADTGQTTQVDYDFLAGGGSVTWALDQRSRVGLGGYVSKYEARDDSTETEAYGVDLGYAYQWSEVIGLEIDVFYEQDDTTDFLPVPGEESTSGWGGAFTGYYEGEVSKWRASVGRNFIPTGSGGKAESDLLRIQYDRDITERLSFRGAGRYEARTSLTERGSSDDRDYARADLSLEYMLAPTWFVRGGYSYIWQDRESATDTADNNKIFLSAGYRGLGRQRR